MGTDDRDVLFRAQRLVDGGSPTADTLMENVKLRARIAALEALLADRHAERVSEIDAHMERVAGLEAQLAQYRWRRVEDEMPEECADVLTWDGDQVLVAFRVVRPGSMLWVLSDSGNYRTRITHWMPLPAAPEEVE